MKVDPSLVNQYFDRMLDLSSEQLDQELLHLETTQPALHAEVKALLMADQASVEVLGFAGSGDGAPELMAGSDFGPYRLEKSLGAGGMGRVYQARRTDGKFEHTVAIKFLHLAASDDSRSRFRGEIQILARFDHPNIVALIDGGDTAQGVYYLVMQWVNGVPLNVAAQSLSLAGRLELVTQLCGAVEYAHQRLIVHRDLKPSNVLVNVDGQVKLLDFGISKDLDDGATQTQALMTPRYAAPEQILGQPVTTATDIFALGMLLFEIVAGKLPPMPEAAALGGLVDYARNFVAPTPSRISDHAVPPDLDAIVLKCLERDPARRYAAVSDLKADLERFVAGRPTSARNLNGVQKVARWAVRNRLSMAGLLAVVMLGVGAVTVHLRQLASERDQAEAALTYVIGLFGKLNPFERGDEQALEIPVADVYRLGLAELAGESTLSGASKADLALAFSQGLIDAGQFPSARDAAESALALASRLPSPKRSELNARAHLLQALSLHAMGDSAGGKTALDKAAAEPAVAAGLDMLAGQYWFQLGNHNFRNGAPEAALQDLARAIDIFAASASSNDEKMRLSQARSDLAWVLNDLGRTEQALTVINQSLEGAEQLDQSDMRLALLYAKRATILDGALKFSESASDHLRAMELTNKVLGPSHRETLAIMGNYALSLTHQRNFPAAVEINLSVIERIELLENRDPTELAATYQNLAAAFKGMGDYANATVSAKHAQEIYAEALAPDHYRHAFPLMTLSELALLQGQFELAVQHADHSIELLAQLPQDHIVRLSAGAFGLAAASRLAGCRPITYLSSAQLRQVIDYLGPERRSSPLLLEVADMDNC